MPTILVTGATGKQGGGLVRALLSQPNTKIHALTRDKTSPASLALAKTGVQLFEGSFTDLPSLTAAAAGCDGLFLNVSPHFDDPTAELQEGRNVLAAALQAGVRHVVYTSVAGTDRAETFIKASEPGSFSEGYWKNKSGIEHAVRCASGVTWTLLRPAMFANSLLLPDASFMFPELGAEGLLRSAISPGRTLPMLDGADVGLFAAAAFKDPEKFGGRTIEIAAELRTQADLAGALGRVSGKTVGVSPFSEEELEARRGHPLVQSQLLHEKYGSLDVDLKKMREWGIKMKGVDAFFEEQREAVLAAVGPK